MARISSARPIARKRPEICSVPGTGRFSPAGDGGTGAREQQPPPRWGVASRKPAKLVVEALEAEIDSEPFLVLAEQRPHVREIGRPAGRIDDDRFGARDDVPVGQIGRHSSSAMLTRRLWRPLFSILPILTRPISPVERTWVPPHGCKSTPATSISRTRHCPFGGWTDIVRTSSGFRASSSSPIQRAPTG